MANIITRRGAIGLGAGAVAAASIGGPAFGQQIQRADAQAPRLPIESGATLRMLRPVRFVQPDEEVFRDNATRFTQQTGVQVRVDFVGWEDINQQTAVTANTGAGPDLIIGFGDAPHIYADKVIELSDVAEYLGKRYGGWHMLAERYGRRHGTNNWIGLPFGASGGPLVYRSSAVREAGFESVPNDHAGYLRLCRELKRLNKPAGFALGNAVGDGNAFANWLIWSHGGILTDENGKVAVNSRETVAALTYLKDLYPTFISGTLGWGDVSNNRAFAANECWLTSNGVSLYFALKNDPATAAVAADTGHQPLPHGVVGRPPQGGLTMNAMVFRHSRYPNAAKAFLQFMLEAEQYDRWLNANLGYWAHPLKNYAASAVWTADPKVTIFRDTMDTPFYNGYRGPISEASGAATAEYIMVQMCASVASGQSTPEQAARDAERRARRYFRT